MIVYKFCSAHWGIDNLSQKRIKASTLEDLNDPFEFNTISFNHSLLRSLWREIRQGMFGHSGIFCFSRDWTNPVIWSHYADSHRGIALGFEVPDADLIVVGYRKHPLRLPSSVAEDPNSEESQALLARAISATASTKFKHWQYEKELRVIDRKIDLIEEDGRFFKPFGANLQLKEVVIGAKSTITSEDVKPLVDKSVKLITARLAFRTFSVVKQRRRDLQK